MTCRRENFQIIPTDGDCNGKIYQNTGFALNPLGSSEILYYKNRTPVFAYNNTIPPPDGPVKEIIQIKMDSLQGRALIGFAISGLALTLVASVVITISRNKAAVRRASATFLMLCTIGYLLSYATNLLYFDTPTVLKCKMRVWFYAGSFSIVTSSLISKNSRICLIYGSRKLLKKFLVKDWLWIGFFSLLVFGEMIVLELWSKYANIRIVSRSTAYSLEYMCEMKSKWEFVIILYNLLLLFGLFAVTYASRNIQQTHSEFTLLLLISILASFGGIVIFAMTGSEVFNISFTVWIITTVPLLTQFAPIILQLYMSFKYREWIEKLESGSARKVVDAPSAIERRKTMKTLRPLSMGKFATSYPAAISIRNRFGFDSEWLRGQLYVGTISGNNEKKEMYFLFEQADFQRPLAFRPKRRDGIIIIARTLEANGHEQIILDTYQGFLVIDFLKENVLSDFENGIKTG
ncbi:hypothetical protein BDR26DRAFT_853143 [Obelidium mucronatum]|nr:hypothetical protein BDR26DRAFT_853143 [Obelidium mucronatum]